MPIQPKYDGPALFASYAEAFKYVTGQYPKFIKHFAFVSLLFLIISLIFSSAPYLLRQTANIVDQAPAEHAKFYFYTLAYAGCWMLANVLENLKGILSAGVLAKSNAALNKKLLGSIFRYTYALQQEINAAVVAQDIARAAMSFSAITVSFFWTICPIFFQFIMTLGIIYFTVGHVFALLFGMSVIVLAWVSYLIAARSGDVHSSLFSVQNQLQGYSVERLNSLLDMRLNNAVIKEDLLTDRYLGDTVRTIWRVNLKMGLYLAAQALAIGLALGVFTVYAIRLNTSATFTGGDFVMIAGYVGMLTTQLRFLSAALIDLKRNHVALERGFEYLNKCPPVLPVVLNNEDRLPISAMPQALFSLEEVSITYGESVLLSRLTYRFKLNQFTAIIAPSGTGKTTLINTMLGLLPAASGRIDFLGEPVTTRISPKILETVAVAPQFAHIFNDSLRFNLTYGADHEISDKTLFDLLEILEYLPEANPENIADVLDEKLGSGGRALSGGEKQRISIARALLRNTQALILDEPTAFLQKALAEKLIRHILQCVATLIVITHDQTIAGMAHEVLSLGKPDSD